MQPSPKNTTVLVTGATGFIASWCIITLLDAGYSVRGTVRSLSSADSWKKCLRPYTERAEEVSLFEADLMQDQGWDEAVAGCEFVLHLASPFPLEIPNDEHELIDPAVGGTLRVLAASARNRVRRVVLTSSVAAISSGHADRNRTFTEEDWSHLNGDVPPYPKSKTMAEQAAWKFMQDLPAGQEMELAVINPGYVLGPVLDDREITSIALHQTLMDGSIPGVTRMKLNIVDVRDVARAHLAAMIVPEAAGKRFICVADGIFLPEVAKILAAHFNPLGFKIPTISVPSWMVRIYALFNRLVRENTRELGVDPIYDSHRMRTLLGWQPLSLEKTIIDTGESLIRHGLVKMRS